MLRYLFPKSIVLTPFVYTGGTLAVAVHEYAPGYINGVRWQTSSTLDNTAL